jgi:hypothetical protein
MHPWSQEDVTRHAARFSVAQPIARISIRQAGCSLALGLHSPIPKKKIETMRSLASTLRGFTAHRRRIWKSEAPITRLE